MDPECSIPGLTMRALVGSSESQKQNLPGKRKGRSRPERHRVSQHHRYTGKKPLDTADLVIDGYHGFSLFVCLFRPHRTLLVEVAHRRRGKLPRWREGPWCRYSLLDCSYCYPHSCSVWTCFVSNR